MGSLKTLGEHIGGWFDRYWLPIGLVAAVTLLAMSGLAWFAAITG